jgi:hypothetical protein
MPANTSCIARVVVDGDQKYAKDFGLGNDGGAGTPDRKEPSCGRRGLLKRLRINEFPGHIWTLPPRQAILNLKTLTELDSHTNISW